MRSRSPLAPPLQSAFPPLPAQRPALPSPAAAPPPAPRPIMRAAALAAARAARRASASSAVGSSSGAPDSAAAAAAPALAEAASPFLRFASPVPADVDFTAALASVPETKVRVRGGVEEEGNEGVGGWGRSPIGAQGGSRDKSRAPPGSCRCGALLAGPGRGRRPALTLQGCRSMPGLPTWRVVTAICTPPGAVVAPRATGLRRASAPSLLPIHVPAPCAPPPPPRLPSSILPFHARPRPGVTYGTVAVSDHTGPRSLTHAHGP